MAAYRTINVITTAPLHLYHMTPFSNIYDYLPYVSLKHVLHVARGQVEGPGGQCACTSTFPGIVSPRKHSRASLSAYADPGIVVKDGANAGPAEAVDRCESASPSIALEGRYGGGTAVN